MKTLRINPTGHDIVLSADIEKQDKFANVNVKLADGQETATGGLTSQEALKISVWFKNLATELAKLK